MKRLKMICAMSFAVFAQTDALVTQAQVLSCAKGFRKKAYNSIGKGVVAKAASLGLYIALGEKTRLLHNMDPSKLYAGLVAMPVLSGGVAIVANSAYGIKKSYSKITENGASDEKKAKHIGSIVGHVAVLVGFAWYANKFKSQIATFLS